MAIKELRCNKCGKLGKYYVVHEYRNEIRCPACTITARDFTVICGNCGSAEVRVYSHDNIPYGFCANCNFEQVICGIADFSASPESFKQQMLEGLFENSGGLN